MIRNRDDPWVDDLTSWEHVAEVLRDDWDRVVQPADPHGGDVPVRAPATVGVDG